MSNLEKCFAGWFWEGRDVSRAVSDAFLVRLQRPRGGS
jgi:hypothetical protein